jgi:hypothetical protein
MGNFCPICGSRYEKDGKYCSNCGASRVIDSTVNDKVVHTQNEGIGSSVYDNSNPYRDGQDFNTYVGFEGGTILNSGTYRNDTGYNMYMPDEDCSGKVASILGFIFAVLGFLQSFSLFGFPSMIMGIVFSALSLSKDRKGAIKAFPITSFILIGLGFLISFVVMTFMILDSREAYNWI